jgi:hypothetical protein
MCDEQLPKENISWNLQFLSEKHEYCDKYILFYLSNFHEILHPKNVEWNFLQHFFFLFCKN